MSDVGFTGGGNDSGMLYVDGKQLAKRNNDELIDSIVSEVEKKNKTKINKDINKYDSNTIR